MNERERDVIVEAPDLFLPQIISVQERCTS